MIPIIFHNHQTLITCFAFLLRWPIWRLRRPLWRICRPTEPARTTRTVRRREHGRVLGRTKFKLVEDSTKRGRVKLVDSRGYTFNVKRRRVTATDWQCTSRPASNPCRATVVQHGDTFQPSLRSHNHPAQVGAALAAIVSAKVKAKAVQDLFKPAPVIVDEVSIGFQYFYIILIEERKKWKLLEFHHEVVWWSLHG